ncbi:MAG: CocE/NonD family hydrolase [Pseudomonadota bacterium]
MGDARYDFFKLYLSWFDHWLRGLPTGANELPRVTYYRMGDGKWLTAKQWPPRHTDMRPYYFSRPPEAGEGDSGQLLETAAASAASASFVYDPGSPLPTLAAPVCCTNPQGEISLEGAHDQSANVTRSDVLIFETGPLDEALNITGPISVNLFVSSDARDTDFTVKLIDVYPDGRAFNIVDGIQRMRWRNGFDVPDFIRPEEIYAISIDLQATSNVFLPGHKLRIEVSSSNFPRFTRNLNTGELNHAGSTFVSATNTVHMGGDHASHVLLPVGEL